MAQPSLVQQWGAAPFRLLSFFEGSTLKNRVRGFRRCDDSCLENGVISHLESIELALVDQPTPLKNDGVKVSWDDDMTPI